MLYLKCVEKIRDKNGIITHYILIDTSNRKSTFESKTVKEKIVSREWFVVNLKLTTDNKLIDRKEQDIKSKIDIAQNNAKVSREIANVVNQLLKATLLNVMDSYGIEYKIEHKESDIGDNEICTKITTDISTKCIMLRTNKKSQSDYLIRVSARNTNNEHMIKVDMKNKLIHGKYYVNDESEYGNTYKSSNDMLYDVKTVLYRWIYNKGNSEKASLLKKKHMAEVYDIVNKFKDILVKNSFIVCSVRDTYDTTRETNYTPIYTEYRNKKVYIDLDIKRIEGINTEVGLIVCLDKIISCDLNLYNTDFNMNQMDFLEKAIQFVKYIVNTEILVKSIVNNYTSKDEVLSVLYKELTLRGLTKTNEEDVNCVNAIFKKFINNNKIEYNLAIYKSVDLYYEYCNMSRIKLNGVTKVDVNYKENTVQFNNSESIKIADIDSTSEIKCLSKIFDKSVILSKLNLIELNLDKNSLVDLLKTIKELHRGYYYNSSLNKKILDYASEVETEAFKLLYKITGVVDGYINNLYYYSKYSYDGISLINLIYSSKMFLTEIEKEDAKYSICLYFMSDLNDFRTTSSLKVVDNLDERLDAADKLNIILNEFNYIKYMLNEGYQKDLEKLNSLKDILKSELVRVSCSDDEATISVGTNKDLIIRLNQEAIQTGDARVRVSLYKTMNRDFILYSGDISNMLTDKVTEVINEYKDKNKFTHELWLDSVVEITNYMLEQLDEIQLQNGLNKLTQLEEDNQENPDTDLSWF